MDWRMLLFVATFVSLYAGMHALVYWGIRPLLLGHPLLPGLTMVWMTLMVLSPMGVRLLDRNDLELPARGLAWVGYGWMGFLWLAFVLCALLALWQAGVGLAGLRWPGAAVLSLHGTTASLLILLLVTGGGLYALYEARAVRVETVTIHTPRLPPDSPALRIAQVSDIHLGLIHREELLAALVGTLRHLEPDLVVATGDIVDAQISHLEELSALWRDLTPPLGKWAVTGNHEVYAGLVQALAYLERSGFEVLRNRGRQLTPRLFIAGVDDPALGGHPDEPAALAEAPEDAFRLLLKHRPQIHANGGSHFDLQLSGHAHRGQIVPFNLLTRLAYPLQDGLTRLAGGGWLYASRGTGTWGPPMRLGSPPEITLLVLQPEIARP